MGLTATKSVRLEAAGLVSLFDDDLALWRPLAQNAFNYVLGGLEESGGTGAAAPVPSLTGSF